MLYNLQPDRSVTGGAWYSDQDFESEFVEVLNQQCFKFLQTKVRHNWVNSHVLNKIFSAVDFALYKLYLENASILPEIYVSTLIGRNSTRKQTKSDDTKK